MASNYGTFIGKLKKPSGDKVQFVSTAKNNENVLLLNATLESDTNKVFVKMVGFRGDKIRVSLGGGEKMEVPWDKRFDEAFVEKAPSWAKTRIRIGDETKEFLSNWDAIEYIDSNYDKIENQQVSLSIKWEKNEYNGNVSDQYTIQGLYPTKEDTKNSLIVRTVFWWNKDSIDDADWGSEKILRVNGYIKSYDKDAKEDLYYPQTIVLNCSKINFDDEHQKAQADYRYNSLKTNSSTYQECKIDCRLISGAEKKDDDDWDESMLTDAQKEQVALGLADVKQFKPGGPVYGDFKTECRFVNFDLTGDYAEGIVDTGLTQEEFEEKMWAGAKGLDPNDDEFMELPDNNDIENLFV